MKERFIKFVERNGWVKGIPTTLTICNSLCGFSAILYTLNAYEVVDKEPAHVFAISCWIILAAMIFDALDGYAARIFNAASLHGLNMDSLSDMVTFGLAPAVVTAIMAHCLRDLNKSGYYFVWTMCAIYIGCAAYRLATYNVRALTEQKKDNYFSGLPTPGAASGICSLVIYYSFENCKFQEIISIIPLYAGVLGLLMVSRIRYFHVGKWLQGATGSFTKTIFLFIIAALIFIRPGIAIIIMINLYILSGPLWVAVAKIAGFFTVKAKTEAQ
jgi:CDP-diacylglycerol--serine O-phosphatidyltransferase